MSYIVFARKYRPKKFDEIIGQSHITTTLKNAITQNRVAHAYLFAGPRGVGKTTTARILAKALNCETAKMAEPCDQCDPCKEITGGMSLDVLEIDGASNRGIDEIRNLKESVKFSPSRGRFKAYIIDEVHMLTAEAFNALLKTLEEPPAHVKFIFATTQAHKVPPTIVSRCQRFDFRRISTKDILENLKNIAKEEKLNVNDDALSLIAKYADGSLRDGQMILDQIMSFAQGAASADDVVDIMGAVSEDVLFGLAGSINDEDASELLTVIDRIVNEGKDAVQVALDLIGHFRNLSVTKISSHPDSLIEASQDAMRRYEEQAKKFTIEEMLYIIYTLYNAIEMMKRTNMARIPLEVAMVKLAKLGSILSLADIMARIDGLESKFGAPGGSGNEGRRHVSPSAPAATDRPTDAPSDSPIVLPQDLVPAEMEEILSSWSGVINYIKAKKISVASYLQEGYPVSLEGGVLSIGFPREFQFHREVLESPENKRLIEEAIKVALKNELRVVFTLVEPLHIERPAIKGEPRKEIDSGDGPATDSAPKKDADPIIESALEIFDAEVSKGRSEMERKR